MDDCYIGRVFTAFGWQFGESLNSVPAANGQPIGMAIQTEIAKHFPNQAFTEPAGVN